MAENLTADQISALADLMIKMQNSDPDVTAEDHKANHEKEMAMYADEAAIAKVTEEYTALFNSCDLDKDGRLNVDELIEFNKKSFDMGAAAGMKMPKWSAELDQVTKDMYEIMNTLEDGEGVTLGLCTALEETVGMEVKKRQGLM